MEDFRSLDYGSYYGDSRSQFLENMHLGLTEGLASLVGGFKFRV